MAQQQEDITQADTRRLRCDVSNALLFRRRRAGTGPAPLSIPRGLIGPPLVGHRVRVYVLRRHGQPSAAVTHQQQGGLATLTSYDLKDKSYAVRFLPVGPQHHAGAPQHQGGEEEASTESLAIHTETDWLLASDDESPIPDEVVTKAVEVAEELMLRQRARESNASATESPTAAQAGSSQAGQLPDFPGAAGAAGGAGGGAGSTAASPTAAWKDRQLRAFSRAVAAMHELKRRAQLLPPAAGGVGAAVGSVSAPPSAPVSAAAGAPAFPAPAPLAPAPLARVPSAAPPLQQPHPHLPAAPPLIPAGPAAQPLLPSDAAWAAPPPAGRAGSMTAAAVPPVSSTALARPREAAPPPPYAAGQAASAVTGANVAAGGGVAALSGAAVAGAFLRARPDNAVVEKGAGFTVLRTASGWEVLAMVPGLEPHEVDVVAWPDGRLRIEGRKQDAAAAEVWGIQPVHLELKLPGPVKPASSHVFLTLHGQLLVQLDAAGPGTATMA